MKEYRLAVIGGDRRGKLVSLPAHQPEKGFTLVAACSLDLSRLDSYRQRCGPDFWLTTDYREIIKDPGIDAVFICTPDYLHEEHCLTALEAGKAVFLEKPMALTTEGCDRILRTAAEHRSKLYVGHNMRFFPVVRRMHELIAAGAIGEVEAIWCRHFISYGGDAYFKDWHSERRYTGSLLLQKGAHDLDIIHWLGGAYSKTVVGMGKLSVYNRVTDRRPPEAVPVVDLSRASRKNWPPLTQKGLSPVIDVEDHSMLLLQLANGVQASYVQCHYTPDDQRNYTIIGTEGRIENYGDTSTPDQWATVHLWNRRTGYSEQGHEVFRIPDIGRGEEHGGADALMIEDFLTFLRGGKTESAKPEDARMAVAAGRLGTESLRNGSIPKAIPELPLY